ICQDHGRRREVTATQAAARPVAAPPQNIEAEESVLGAMLLAEAAVDAAIFRAIRSLSEKSSGIDPLTVCAELERRGELETAGGKSAVYELATAVPTAGNARYYAG